MRCDALALSLLEFLAYKAGCPYLSDLRFLSPEQRRYLAQSLERLTPRKEDTWEWNAALDYLTGAPPEAAKERLVHLLSQPCGAGIDKAT